MIRGNFITFEGGDGVGKSTQIRRLENRLRVGGLECVTTREPGGTPFAERVRDFILASNLPAHPAMAEALLFAAARYDHVENLIKPALSEHKWVLCDRFSDSTRAYQGAAGGVDRSSLVQLEALTHESCTPDLTLILDLDPSEGRARIASRRSADASNDGDPFEARDLAFQARLREAFLDIAAEEPGRCRIIDAGAGPDAVEEAIWKVVARRFRLGTD
ncbi:MAG: dTMP kinase [Alphaproteobacteria bacterium]|nr:dTMP kinase [Alphaproteobacteria bacterium]